MLIHRRTFIRSLGVSAAMFFAPRTFAQIAADSAPSTDVTFVFIADVHACRMGDGLSPNCLEEGKTDEDLLRHIAALNALPGKPWPQTIGGSPSGLASAGQPIAAPAGIILGGDMTDDGGGQVKEPGEGTQLRQFSQRYVEGSGPDNVHVPVYTGLGNHDLDQDGPAGHVDWYRRELRDYVEVNHRDSVFFKAPVPAQNYDVPSDSYSWDFGRLRLVQLHRFAGDTRKGAVSGLDWLKQDLAQNAGDGRPVVLFQHYGWDAFSTENWDPSLGTFDDEGGGAPHWWTPDERSAFMEAISGFNIIGLFHGHQHETPMIYQAGGLDLFKPKAAFLGGFALARVTDDFLDVALGEATEDSGGSTFTHAFSKPLSG